MAEQGTDEPGEEAHDEIEPGAVVGANTDLGAVIVEDRLDRGCRRISGTGVLLFNKSR
jgi:hypothetical protein